MQRLDVSMLGGFQLELDGVVVPPIPSRQARSLLAFLLLHRDRRHRREHLIGLFWPDMPTSRARRRLSHTLWQLQDVLGELRLDRDLIESSVDHVGIDPDASVHVDVEGFERGVQRHRPDRAGAMADLHGLDAAIETYQGELLVGHDDDWILPERERLRQIHLDALGWLVGVAKGHGANDEALVYARRLTVHDPLREDAHREVMRLCTLLGRTAEALRQYERCKSVLLEELDAEPAVETVQLATFIGRQRSGDEPTTLPAIPDVADVRLIGRDAERRVLIQAIERVLSGRGASVMVEAEAGLGCTRLLRQCREDATWRNLHVLQVRGGVPPRPYQAIVEALTGDLSPIRVAQLRGEVDEVWRSEAARLLPVLGEPTGARLHGAEGRDRLLEALVRVVCALLASEPSLLIVDDLDKLDLESLVVLETAAERLVPRGLGLVIASRSTAVRERDEAWQSLQRLDALAVPDRLQLAPLSAGDTMELVRGLLPGVVPLRFAQRVHEETGGNPLFVVETVRAVRAQGLEGLDEIATLPLPPTIHELVSDGIRRYDGAQQRVAATAALLGEGLDLGLLREALGPHAADVGPTVPRLLRDGMIRADGEQLTFVHEQVRRVVVDVAADGDVRRRVATLLAEVRPDRIGEAAELFEAAGDLADAVRAHERAADRAKEVHAYADAADRLQHALDLQATTVHDQDHRRRMLWELEEVLAVLGRRDEQRVVLDELRRVSLGTDEETRAWRRAASYAATTDDLEQARECAARAIDTATGERERGLGLVELGSAALWQGSATEAVGHLQEAVGLLDGIDEGQARATLGDARRRAEDLDGAVAEFEQAIDIAVATGDVQLEVRTLSNLAATRMAARDMAAARRVLLRSLDLGRSIGYLRAQVLALGNLGYVEQKYGRVLVSLEHLDEAQSIASSIRESRLLAGVRMNAASLLHHALGRHVDAAERAAQAGNWFMQAGDHDSWAMCQETLASVELQADRPEDALCRMEAIDPQLVSILSLDQLVPTVAESAIRTNRVDLLAPWTRRSSGSMLARAWLARWSHMADDVEPGRLVLDEYSLVRPDAGEDDPLEALRSAHAVWLVARDMGVDEVPYLKHARRLLEVVLDRLDPDVHDAVIERRDIREVLGAADRVLPSTRTVMMASVTAPTGRELGERDRRRVDLLILPHRSSGDRRRALVQIVEQAAAAGAVPTVSDLAAVLEVSDSTVRRDLRGLRASGREIATRGSRAG